MAGPLSQAIDAKLKDNPVSNGIRDWWARVGQRWTAGWELVKEQLVASPWISAAFVFPMLAALGGYALTGVRAGLDAALFFIPKGPTANPSASVAEALNAAFRDPRVKEITEIVGALVTEPVLALFEQYAGDDQKDPKEFARSFHGFMLTLNASGGLADILTEALSVGTVKGVGNMLQSMYWTLGLGFLGWQTLAPLLSSGLQPGLERYYKRLYRPMRFSAADLRDLFALGEITPEEFKAEVDNLGWRDADFDKWKKLAFRKLPESDVWALFHTGQMGETEVKQRLAFLGYDPAEIPLLFKVNQDDQVNQAAANTVSTVRSAFKDKLIGETEYRSTLKSLKKTDREVDLLFQIDSQDNRDTSKRLSQGAIKAAFETNVLTEPEVRFWLKSAGFEDDAIPILVDTWKAELAPAFAKLNRTTITGAYVEGILTRPAALQKLVSVGLAPDDARLELDLVEARNPEAFGRPAPPRTRVATVGELTALVQARLITPEVMKQHLVDLGYGDTDAGLLVQLAQERAKTAPTPLSQSTVERAYIAGVLNRSQSGEQLGKLGFTSDEVKVILDTVEASNPAVFAPESIQSTRQPSTTALVAALQNGIITDVQYFARMLEAGYDQPSAQIFLAVAQRSVRKSVRQLTVSDITKAYDRSIFSYGVALARLTDLGYSEDDATLILRLTKSGVADTEVFQNMLAGLVTPDQAIPQLLAMGFTLEEVQAAITAAGG